VARTASLALAIGIALLAGYAAFAAKGWQWKAALFPLAIGIPLCCLAVIEVVLSCLDKQSAERAASRGSALPWAWMGGFLALIVLLGFPIAVAVFVFGYLKLQSKEGWVVSGVYTAALWAAFYTLFDYLLHLPFPAGWLLAWLGLA
jgi:hypothetical protein